MYLHRLSTMTRLSAEYLRQGDNCGELRDYFARVSHADFTEPITASIFVSIAAHASVQRRVDANPLLENAEG